MLAAQTGTYQYVLYFPLFCLYFKTLVPFKRLAKRVQHVMRSNVAIYFVEMANMCVQPPVWT